MPEALWDSYTTCHTILDYNQLVKKLYFRNQLFKR